MNITDISCFVCSLPFCFWMTWFVHGGCCLNGRFHETYNLYENLEFCPWCIWSQFLMAHFTRRSLTTCHFTFAQWMGRDHLHWVPCRRRRRLSSSQFVFSTRQRITFHLPSISFHTIPCQALSFCIYKGNLWLIPACWLLFTHTLKKEAGIFDTHSFGFWF